MLASSRTAMLVPLGPLVTYRRSRATTGVGMHSRVMPPRLHSSLPVRGSKPSSFSDELSTSTEPPPGPVAHTGEDHESHASGRSAFQRLAPVRLSTANAYEAP